jgi:hypothetical protein
VFSKLILELGVHDIPGEYIVYQSPDLLVILHIPVVAFPTLLEFPVGSTALVSILTSVDPRVISASMTWGSVDASRVLLLRITYLGACSPSVLEFQLQ